MNLRHEIETGGGHKMAMNEHGRLGFSLEEYQRRYDVVLSSMREAGLDALLIRSPENMCYVSGFETPGYYKYHGLILADGQEPVLVLRRFEILNVWEYSWLTNAVPVDDWEVPGEVMARQLEKMGLANKRIGVEKAGWFFTVEEYEILQSVLPNATLADGSTIVEQARLIKSEEEVQMIRRSAYILDHAVQAGIDTIAVGRTDNEVAAEVNRVLIEMGGEYMGLPPFILSGDRTCLPHQTAASEMIEPFQPFYFEVSCSQHRYAAAIMRTVSVGDPTPKAKACAEAVIGGLEAALDIIKPGVSCEEADTAARSVIEKAGFGEAFRHRLGYSIGVNFPPDWGEGQILSLRQGEPRPLEPNMTFHMVPLCLIYREFGIGFSATIRVTETGNEVFTKLPLEFTVV
jgi:Xaa-Pro dipeptidase